MVIQGKILRCLDLGIRISTCLNSSLVIVPLQLLVTPQHRENVAVIVTASVKTILICTFSNMRRTNLKY